MELLVLNSNVRVDFVVQGDSDDIWLMVLVEEGPWLFPYDAKLQALQERIYSCIDAAIDGQVAARFPQAKGKRICIRIDAYDLPQAETQAFFDRFSAGVLKIPEYAQALVQSEYVSDIEFEIRFDQA